MQRTTLLIGAAALLTIGVAACGGDDGAATYSTTRDGREPPETRPRETRPPRTEPSTPGTIVLPTFPSTSSTEGTDDPPSTVAPAGDITVTGTWLDDDGFGTVSWGATFESSSATATEYAPVLATFYDATGAQIGTAESTLPLVQPGKSAIVDYTFDLESTPASVEVTIGAGDPTDFVAAGELTTAGLALDPADGTLSGQITSTYPTDLEDVSTVAVWRDAAGSVTGIASDNVRVVLANGVTWLSLYAPSESTDVPAEVYVTPRPSPYQATPPDAALAVTESWFQPDGGGNYDWGAIVQNTGTTTWSVPLALAKFFDAEGRLIDTDDGYLGLLRPGTGAVVGYIFDPPAEAVRLEVAFVDGGYADDPIEGDITVTDLVVTPDGAGNATLTGTATSTLTEDHSYIELIAVWRDAAGAVTYSTSGFIEEIAAGGTAPVEVSMYGVNVPTSLPSELYWSA